MPGAEYHGHFALRNWMSLIIALSLLPTHSPASAQTNSIDEVSPQDLRSKLRLGPFDLHPRLGAGMIYDDNLLLTTASKEADEEWNIQPAPQAVAGDKAAVVAYRDNENMNFKLR